MTNDLHDSSTQAPRPRGIHLAMVAAGLVALTLVAFHGVLDGAFVAFDDDAYVTDNTHVTGGVTADSVAWAFEATDQGNWHPLTWLSHMVDVELFGLRAGGHHATSLLIHVVNTILLLLLLVRMTGALWRSALAAALFALHPLHVESVAWIAERKDVLSTLFWLLTTMAWVGYLGSKSRGRYALVVALYALGLMAKPMLVTLPFTLLLLDYWPLGRAGESLRARLIEKAPLFALAAGSCVVTFVVQRAGGAVQTLQLVPVSERVANALLAYVTYLAKTIRPVPLAIFYPHPHTPLFSAAVAGSALLLAGLTWLALRAAKRAPYLAVGWLWYLGTLVPVIGLVQIGGQSWADRYTYVPLIGIFVAIAWGLGDLARRSAAGRYVVAAGSVTAVAALLVVTRAQVAVWADGATLFRHAIAVTSNNYTAYNALGAILIDQRRYDDAIASLEQAIKLRPDSAVAHFNLGTALAGAGKTEGAVDQFIAAMRLDPGFAPTPYNLGNALSDAGRLEEAVASYRLAIKLAPERSESHANLANALSRMGRLPQAVEEYERALVLRPDDVASLSNLGFALVRLNRLPQAIDRLQLAVRLDPTLAEAHNTLGIALASDHRLPEAIEHFKEAVRLNPNFENAKNNLRTAEADLAAGR